MEIILALILLNCYCYEASLRVHNRTPKIEENTWIGNGISNQIGFPQLKRFFMLTGSPVTKTIILNGVQNEPVESIKISCYNYARNKLFGVDTINYVLKVDIHNNQEILIDTVILRFKTYDITICDQNVEKYFKAKRKGNEITVMYLMAPEVYQGEHCGENRWLARTYTTDIKSQFALVHKLRFVDVECSDVSNVDSSADGNIKGVSMLYFEEVSEDMDYFENRDKYSEVSVDTIDFPQQDGSASEIKMICRQYDIKDTSTNNRQKNPLQHTVWIGAIVDGYRDVVLEKFKLTGSCGLDFINVNVNSNNEDQTTYTVLFKSFVSGAPTCFYRQHTMTTCEIDIRSIFEVNTLDREEAKTINCPESFTGKISLPFWNRIKKATSRAPQLLCAKKVN